MSFKATHRWDSFRPIVDQLRIKVKDSDVSISRLRLSTRPYNALTRAGIRQISQLIALAPAEILSIKWLGTRSLKEILYKIEKYALISERGLPQTNDAAETFRLEGSQAVPVAPIRIDFMGCLLVPLSERQRKTMRLRYGMDDGVCRTLQEVGSIIGVSRERVRQIESRSLTRLRHKKYRQIWEPVTKWLFELLSALVSEQRSDLMTLAERAIISLHNLREAEEVFTSRTINVRALWLLFKLDDRLNDLRSQQIAQVRISRITKEAEASAVQIYKSPTRKISLQCYEENQEKKEEARSEKPLTVYQKQRLGRREELLSLRKLVHEDVVTRAVFEQLRSLRLDRANRLGVPPYIVAHNRLLYRISLGKPQSLNELARIPGVGSKTLERYGADIVGIVRKCLASTEHNNEVRA